MPPKIKDLIKHLEKAGFKNRGGKGSHRNYIQPHVLKSVTLSGKSNDDARIYLIKAVEQANKRNKRGATPFFAVIIYFC